MVMMLINLKGCLKITINVQIVLDITINIHLIDDRDYYPHGLLKDFYLYFSSLIIYYTGSSFFYLVMIFLYWHKYCVANEIYDIR